MSAIAAFALRTLQSPESIQFALDRVWNGGRIQLRMLRSELIVELGWFSGCMAQLDELKTALQVLFEASQDGEVYYYRNAEMVRENERVPERSEPISVEALGSVPFQPTMEFGGIERIRLLPMAGPGC